MDKMDGFAFAKVISEQNAYRHIPIIFLTAKSTRSDKLKGLRLGAIDLMQKPFSFEELSQKIENLLGSFEKQKKAALHTAISNLKTSNNFETNLENEDLSYKLDQNCRMYKLTNREIEVAKLIIKGLSYKKIGKNLFIAERTVATHVGNIFEKTGVSNKVGLINKLRN